MEPARWLILEHVAGNLPSVAVSFHEIPDAAAPVRGEGAIEFAYTLMDPMRPENAEVHVRTELLTNDFEHALAHELLHVASNVRRLPVPALNPRIPTDAPEMGIVRDLITIGCVANDQLLGSLGFDASYIFTMRVQRLLRRITETRGASDDLSKPWAVRTTIHYVRALLDSGPGAMSEVRVGLRKLPRIRAAGDKLYSEVALLDLQDHSQRLDALVSIRDTFSLTGRIYVIEPGERVQTH